jgi:DNA-binding winged helix-turn-helix (wHTH) protein
MLSKDKLLKQIWPDSSVEKVNLAVNISAIRKAFEDHDYR